MKDITSAVVNLLILLFQVILIMATIGSVQYRLDIETCRYAAEKFVDTAIDLDEITDNMLSDLNLACSARYGVYSVEPKKYTSVTNPVPGTTTNEVYVTEVLGNIKDPLNPYDRIEVYVRTIELPRFVTFARSFVGNLGLTTHTIKVGGIVR